MGTQPYYKIYEDQKKTIHWSKEREEIWGMEHPTVITLGRRANFLNSTATVESNEYKTLFSDHSMPNIPVVHTDRGGLITLHSPGQLIIYPLLSLAKRQWGAKEYVCQLLKITKKCLGHLGIETHWDQAQSGLFHRDEKIVYIGLKISEGRCYHGLSVNVSNNLNLITGITSCGMKGRPTTSLSQNNLFIDTKTLFNQWVSIALKEWTDQSLSSEKQSNS